MIFLDDAFRARQVRAEEMDLLWANGWRHFGVYFFRYSLAEHGGRICNVMPLRIELIGSDGRVLGTLCREVS